MKSLFLKAALICASIATLSSCVEELEKKNAAPSGSEVAFGARAGFENSKPETKTVYTGEVYQVGNVKFERIDWLDANDKIEIYSPQAINGPTSHYQINRNNVTDTEHDYATLSRIGESSLQWNGDGEHLFYAMYPSSLVFNDLGENTIKQGVKMNSAVLNGVVPSVQNPSRTVSENGNYVLEPDMRYAYMAAKTSATRFDETVSLTFVPVVTAVKVSMTVPNVAGAQAVTISEIQVSGTGIAGSFSADLSKWGTTTYPTCVNATGGTNKVQITPNNVLSVEKGKTVTFTVFLRPGADISDLKVSISSDGAAYVGKTLQDVVIPAGKKTVLSNLSLPKAIEIDASNWMSQLDPQTKMNRLSIPGTGSTFSYNYNESDKQYIQSQTLNLEQQWAKGIRAFEIISERQSRDNGNLGSKKAMCNNKDMGVTVNEVFNTLYSKVTATGSSETAILILTYQPAGDNGRDPIVYLNNLKTWINGMDNSHRSVLKVFTPNMTLAEAQNKILIIVRPTQRDEDYQTDRNLAAIKNVVSGLPVLVVDGCGTGKDRWGARGYTINGTRALDISNYAGTRNSGLRSEYVEQYMTSSDYKLGSGVAKAEADFRFATNYDDVTCWYQEWARVIPQNMFFNSTIGVVNKRQDTAQYPYWFESYTEKLDNVISTFEMAVSDNYQQYVFINSLCGHYGTTSRSKSLQVAAGNYWGGTEGDVKALADDINAAFYNHVRNSGFEQKTGPTGIVMMNFVSNNESDGAAYFLPGTIISNNFKHNVGRN